MAESEKLRIGDFVLDPSRNLLCGLEGATSLEPRVVDVLLTLAAQPGVVLSRDALIDAVWKTEFGADERLTRAIYQLRKAFGDDRGTHRYIETVSKRGYRLVAAVEVLVETPVQSELLATSAPAPPNAEASSLGPQTDAPMGTAVDVSYAATTERSPPASPARWWQNRSAYATGAVAVLAIAVIAAWLWPSSGPAATPYTENVIELRPVVVIGDEPGLAHFARQTHATLRWMLASYQLSVVEHSATPTQDRAERRNSEFTLSGTLEKTADAYAMTLYFDNRADGQTLWSRRFVRAARDEAGLREEIGANAAHEIGCGLNQRAQAKRKPSSQAFMIYLELCDSKVWTDNGATALARALRLVAIAPDDAYGHGMVAFVNSIMAADRPDLTQTQIDTYASEARSAAARALELDPKNDDALWARALLSSHVEYWLSLDAFGKRQAWYHAVGLRQSGRLKEALHLNTRILASAPLSFSGRVFQAALTLQAGHHEMADRMLADVLQHRPDHPGANFYRFASAAFYGDPERALALLKVLPDVEGAMRACWRAFLEARRQPADRRDVVSVRAACEQHYRTSDGSVQDRIVRMLGALGDVNGAYELMRTKSWTWRGSTILLWYPEMAAVRRDARFMPLILPSHLPEYWLKSGHWPDFCRDDVLPYDCKAAAQRALTDLPPRPRDDAVSRSKTDVVYGGSEVGDHD